MVKRKKNNKLKSIIVYSVMLFVVAGGNVLQGFIAVPSSAEMVSRQIDYVTISTVFAGFAFTAMGILMGMSSEELIEKIKGTDIIMNKISRIIRCIVFFFLSVAISLFFILGLDQALIRDADYLTMVDSFLYILGIGYMIGGIAYFMFSVYELYDLLKRVYAYNTKETEEQIAKAEAEMERTRKEMRKAEEKSKLESDYWED